MKDAGLRNAKGKLIESPLSDAGDALRARVL